MRVEEDRAAGCMHDKIDDFEMVVKYRFEIFFAHFLLKISHFLVLLQIGALQISKENAIVGV